MFAPKNFLFSIDDCAAAGLSASAGFTYGGERFHKYFSDFEKRYGFHDMYSGGFYPYNSLEEYWAYWSRYIYVNHYMNAPKEIEERAICIDGDIGDILCRCDNNGKRQI